MKKLHISTRTMIFIGFLFLAVSVFLTAGVYAKYVAGATSDKKMVTAKTFYFTSNYLTDIDHKYKLNEGTQEITIELYNYDCENPLLISEVDCSYKVTVETDDPEVYIDGANTKTKTFNYDYATSEFGAKTQNVKLSYLNDGYTYKVTVEATGGDVIDGEMQLGGYKKTLSATFTVAKHDGFYMNVDETDPNYIVLTVWTENIKGDVTVTFPAGLIPDTTNPRLAGVNNYDGGIYGEGTFTDDVNFETAYSSYSYRFFKTSSYTSGTFDVKDVKLGEKSATLANIP